MAAARGKTGLIVVLLALAASTSGGVFFWGRQTIAMPACVAFAQTRGLKAINYKPVIFRTGKRSRTRLNNIDGSCVLTNRDGVQRTHDLTPELHGWKRLAVVSLRHDLIFCVALVGWGLVIAMWPRGIGKRKAG
ncbi:MAG: hypothetical protein P0Y64_00700 [Candidatus Sphingomonas colombiensis]|nr:hypothetical protein [Sphingomonas sp.]WEK43403.1 MAG: hypothetical protein P0Y64_00700 [Sphingomonas sp.]